MNMPNVSPVICRCLSGDTAAQEELVLAAQNRVYYHCIKMLKNEENALDATQEVLISMLTKLDGLQNPDAFWGWLSAMTANYCRNVLTRGRHEVQIPEDDEGHSLLDTFENLDDQTVPDKALDNDETRRMVVDLVDQLPPSQRQCVLMFYYEEMSVKDIAAALETSEGTIKSRLNYARKAIKAGVEQYAAQGIKLYGAVPFLLYFLQKDALLGGLNASASQALAHTVLTGAAGTAAGITAAAGTTALGSTVSGSIGGGAAAAGTTTAVESAAGVSAASAGSVAAGGGAASAGGGAAHALGGILAHKGALGLAGIILAGAVTGGIVLHQAAPAPVSVVEEAFDTGGNLGAAIDAEGMLWAWGDSGDGELGSQVPPGGPGAHSDTPILVLEDTYAVACGLSHLAAIKTDGTLWTWGNNEYGQLGTGDMGKQSYLDEWNLMEHTYSDAPLQVLDQVTAISASQYTTAAVRRDGSLWMAGGNGNGQFGNGTSEGSDVFVQVMDSGVKDVACGNNYTLILKTDGSLWACGDNTYGQLGDGTQNPSLQPIQIMLDVAEIDTGGFVSAAVKTDGTLWTWGLNYYEALGFGKGGNLQDEHGYLQAIPVQVMDNVSAVSCSGQNTMAVKTDGTLWVWGANQQGTVGNGGGTNSVGTTGVAIQNTPVQILTDVAAAKCSITNGMAVKTDGSVWVWGRSTATGGATDALDQFRQPIQSRPYQMPGITCALTMTLPDEE